MYDRSARKGEPMNFRSFAALAAAAALAPALAAAQDQSLVFAQADFRDPNAFAEAVDSKINNDAIEVAQLKDLFVHIDRAMRDRLSGNLDSANAEDKIAADYLVNFVNKYPSHRLRIVFLRMAAARYLAAKEWEKGAEAAQRIIEDPKALPISKVIGAQYASGGWQMLAVGEMRAGKIPQLKLQPSTARGGVAPSPRLVDRPWKMFVEAADVYEANRDADPVLKVPEAERAGRGGPDLGQLLLIAAQVEFGYDNIEDAQRRFRKVIDQFPSRADLLETAVPYYLDTFRILKNPKGAEEEAGRLAPILEAEAKKATALAAVPGASEETKKGAATLTRLATELKEGAKGNDYNTAGETLAKGDAATKEGKPEAAKLYRDAAALYEKFAAENKTSPDAPSALFNAGIAWDKAKEGKKALAAREALVAGYPDAKMVPQTLLLLGSNLAAAKEYAAAVKYLQEYLARWPDAPQRCLALQNLGVALHETKKSADAGATYLKFANDPVCAKEDPNTTARVLYSAARVLNESKKTADEKKALQALVAIQGVTDAVAKSYQSDAKARLAKMK
jgi:tetratricopeptide (TPR) repeat protein